MNNIVSLEYLNDYDIEELKKAIQKGFYRVGIKNLIKPQSKVLLKVCLPDAVSQDSAETTHPAVVRAVADCLYEIGVKCLVADCPKGKFNEHYFSDVYLNTGMLEMANLTTCELNQDLSTCNVEIPNGLKTKSVKILEVVNDVDCIINIGKLKFDEQMGYLGATSNIFGLIPGPMQELIVNRLSTYSDFNDYIIDMYETLKNKVVLNILDGVVALEANKTQRMLNLLAMSESAYAVDAVVFDVLKIKYENTLLKQAQNRDLFDFQRPYRIDGEKTEKFNIQDFSLIEFDNHTEFKHKKGYFASHQQRPTISKNKCKGCKICSKICPTNAIMMKYDNNGELYAEIDYKKCIFCNKCVNACPYSVVEQKTPLAYKSMTKEIEKYNKCDDKNMQKE